MNTSNQYRFLLFFAVAFVTIFTVTLGLQVLKNPNVNQWTLLILAIVFAGIAAFFVVKFSRLNTDLRMWSAAHKLEYRQSNCYKDIWQRLEASPGKKFLGARQVHYKDPPPLTSTWKTMNSGEDYQKFVDGPFATGIIEKRNIWVYAVDGFLHANTIAARSLFFGWCLELSTHPIPVSVSVNRRFLGHTDSLDTESRIFEKLYDIDSAHEGAILQLLDPVMMELIVDSDITAIEFSDSSVVLIHSIFPPKQEDLNKYYYFGTKIAEQVDRNFPLAKYEKT